MILFVVAEAGESFGERGVDLFEMVAELLLCQIGAAVEDDHEFEHGLTKFLSPLRGSDRFAPFSHGLRPFDHAQGWRGLQSFTALRLRLRAMRD